MKPVLGSWPESGSYPCLPGEEILLELYIGSWLGVRANPIKPPRNLVQLSVFAVNKSLGEHYRSEARSFTWPVRGRALGWNDKGLGWS